jgi:hypothetical protein
MRHWPRQRKCNLTAILLLGLLPWVEPASAQTKEYSLTVSVHAALVPRLTPAEIEQILKDASDLLKIDNNCDVEFKLGSVQTHTGPADIYDDVTLEAVHSVDADVKVVNSITFCTGRTQTVWGCAWRPHDRRKTVIVTNFVDPNLRGILWAHEFGHTTGLPHRMKHDTELLEPLMTGCEIQAFTVLIDRDECDHFRAGPTGTYPPDPIINCDQQRR